MADRRDPFGNYLVPRMHYKHGGYYRVAKNVWQPLGTAYPEALREWAKREGQGPARTVAQACEAYLIERGPELKPKTLKEYERNAASIAGVLGACFLDEVSKPDVKAWHRKISARTEANRQKAFLSAVYSFAVSEGWTPDNPCKGIRRHLEKPRTRTSSYDEAVALAKAATPLWRALVALAFLTGMRPGELRELRRDHLTPDGIDLVRPKTEAHSLILWTPALLQVTEQALAAHPKLKPGKKPEYVFPAPHGRPYSVTGFSHHWAALCKLAGVKGLQMRDARRTAATEAEDLKHAQELLGHDTPSTTRRVYRVRDRVRPVA